MIEYKIKYKVNRFNIWWNSTMTVIAYDHKDKKLLLRELLHAAAAEDMGKIKALKILSSKPYITI